jgi:hypothetical protein
MAEAIDWTALTAEVCRRHGAHTVLLYGSRARGDATSASDVDLIAIRQAGGAQRDVTPWRGLALDVHVFDEAGLADLVKERTPNLVDARVLVDQGGTGARLLDQVRARLATPPPSPSEGEWAALWAWGDKMRGRVRAADPTLAALHRATLLVEAPGAWAEVRGRWFFGAKAMLGRWVKDDPAFLEAYRAAARPVADLAVLDRLLALTFDRAAACRPPP